MYSSTAMRQKNSNQETCAEGDDPFNDKRRLLSYWNSLDTCPVDNETGNDEIRDELVVELKKCLSELDNLDSLSNTTPQEACTMLQNEQLSLLNQLGEFSVYFKQESSHFDLNENFKNSAEEGELLDALKAERKLLLKNENLVKEYKASSKEQQMDIEKLTREVQNFNISRRKLERELLQITKQKNENEATINSLRDDMKVMKDSYEIEIQKLSNMNDQAAQENSELVEKGKEATESLKIALHQLTEEKKAMQVQRKSSSGKDIRDIEASLERAKKEREAFRQRCEKSEVLQRNLQEEISSLKNELAVKEKALSTRPSFDREIVDGGSSGKGRSSSVEGNDSSLDLQGLQRSHSRISQLKKYVHVLEGRIKEKDDTILSLRKENARANDVVMEKSLELSKSRRMLERKIEKLTRENSDFKRKLLIPNSYGRKPREDEETGSKLQQEYRKERERNSKDVVESRQRRRSNPERSAIETVLKNSNDGKPQSENKDVATETMSSASHVVKPGDRQDSGKSIHTVSLDVTPRRRIGGKFIRASSKRHSADLGKLMSRPEPIINRKPDNDMLHEDEPATIFINKYRKKSEEEEHWV